MNGVVRQHRSLRSTLIIVILAALNGCAANQPETAIDWNSPAMREIEHEWQSLWDAYGKVKLRESKAKYVELVASVDRLFWKRLSAQRLRHLAATAETLPVLADDRSQFDNELLAFMVKALVKLGDRESLVELLSKRCTSRIDWPELLEFTLTFRGKELKDPILILGEAYARCVVPETRHILAASVRRSFADFRIPGNDDAERVANAMRWYEKEKDDLVVNQSYTLNETSHGISFTVETYETHPEFYDNPPEPRDPLFRRRSSLSREDRFHWRRLTLITISVVILVALITIRTKAQRRRNDLPVSNM
jgi:hypothetical protein